MFTVQKVETKYVSVVDTAKLIRYLLLKEYPGVKFSVKSSKYAGGASVDIYWSDGPTCHQVNKMVEGYAGATFDGSRDIKSYQTAIVDGQVVQYGADYVFVNRSYTKEFMEAAAVLACEKFKIPVPEIVEGYLGFGPDYDTAGKIQVSGYAAQYTDLYSCIVSCADCHYRIGNTLGKDDSYYNCH